ncbi:hypothetical protein GE061_002106 [Apolygus lucorum]|uniref:Uncharacterized protein n=1 Tax=Apolygus lucorum TaxID=248454 RepID=A0A6A4J919_APOLU|nr:hypothetical protein GE061_002106 [Apolygus lucorum]
MGGSWDAVGQELPITLINVTNSPDNSAKKRFALNENVEKVLSANDVCDLKVAIVSVAGIMRAGKSFLISFLLRYATYMYYKLEDRPEKPREELWMGSEMGALNGGFQWRHAVRRQTNGILMWPVIFKCKLQNGESIGLIFLDTQGTHDGETTSSIWSSVFALSTLISSLQMYNVMRAIGEEQLQNLELYGGYGKLIAQFSAGETPYQSLMFIVRDFKNGMEYPFGIGGGEAYLQDQVINSSSFPKQSQEVRKHIMGFFENLSCCVLPDPGPKVMEEKSFDGKMRDIDLRFREVIQKFVPTILTPENLVLKKINGNFVTTREMFNYMRVWVDCLNDASLPRPKSLFTSTSMNDHNRVMNAALDMYSLHLEALVCSKNCFMKNDQLKAIHNLAFEDALKYFFASTMLGKGGEATEIFHKILEDSMNEKFFEYQALNNARIEILEKAVRTPINVFVCIGICTVLEYLEFKNAAWLKLVSYAALLQWLKTTLVGGIMILKDRNFWKRSDD